MKIVDKPEELGETDPGWISFAQDNYANMRERMHAKGKLYDAFAARDEYLLGSAIADYKMSESFQSSNLIEYQGDKKFLL